MLINALAWLRETGLDVERLDVQPSGRRQPGADAILAVGTGDSAAQFFVEVKGRAPYPNELAQLRMRQGAFGEAVRPLLVVPFVSEALGPALIEAGWSWADAHGNFDLRAPGLVLRQRRTKTAAKPRRKSLPQGTGSTGIIRALINFGGAEEEEPSATALAAQAKVSQPRASQVLRQLNELNLVERSVRGRWRPNREELLDRFLAEYPGPGGSQRYFYSLDSPGDAAARAANTQTLNGSIAVSADVGPDVLLAWRRPSVLILYSNQEVPVDDLGLVQAQGRHDANVIVRYPDDQSIFPVPALVSEVRGVEIPLADPSQLIWDLQDLGGADRLEAAGMLREWLLTRP